MGPCLESATHDLWSEVDILLKIEPHPHICNLLGYCNDEGQFYTPTLQV